MPLLAHNVSFAYRPGRPVLREVCAAFAPGALTVVIGPNGAGKSTLLRVLLGTLTPSAGTVTLDGEPTHRLPGRVRAGRIAYVPQSATLAEPFAVGQVVRLGRYARPADPASVEAALDRLQLAPLVREPFGTLSAGQQQRTTLARALAQLAGADADPARQVLLADEPCSAMDPRHAMHAMGILREQAARGMTVVVILHDFAAALRFADRAVVLDASGSVASEAPVDEAMSPALLARVFGIPFERLSSASDPGRAAALLPGEPTADMIPEP